MLEYELEIARPVREVYGALNNPENMRSSSGRNRARGAGRN